MDVEEKKEIKKEGNGKEKESKKRRKESLEELKMQYKKVDCNLGGEGKGDKIEKIRKQMEFYFGDSNLANDKFMRQLVMKGEKGYVDLEAFFQFNRIKKLVEKNEEKKKLLISAISTSKILKLSKNKEKVRRKIPFQIEESAKKDIDDSTIYVENIPESIEHEDLAKLFSKSGNILHISMPKFSKTKKNKGFAFIQFSVKIERKSLNEKRLTTRLPRL